jgi:NAD(P)-dependent dehydrogenase (short-subunit alcohol dehydrogenase family)
VAIKDAVNGPTRKGAVDDASWGIRIRSLDLATVDTPMVERTTDHVSASMALTERPAGGGTAY